jgi:Druantia protein DruA/Transposase DNA-binding/Transposase Tn5 dimerisation domain/Transposase DDE domain
MDASVVVCGQVFSHELLQRINATLNDHPDWSRAELARRVCDWLHWRTEAGQPKQMSCRVALRRLAERAVISLPAPRHRVSFGGQSFSKIRLNVPSRLEGTVKDLSKLKLVLVSANNRELDLQWKKLVATHHYLGYRPLCGAQLRYLIVCEHGYVGALGFSAAALYLKARDRWIGWSHQARQAHLRYVVANSRFVIACGVKVANLASKVLGMAQRRLAKDWAQAYGYRPLLVETYVESKRFGATSYRAANWIYVGKTCGRGRQDRDHRKEKPLKDIYLFPLQPNCQKLLCEEPGPARHSPTWCGKPQKPPCDWAEQEFGNVRLRDRRHRQRLFTVARDFYAQPAANIPQACQSRAKTKAAYRLFEHKAVSMEAILSSHYHSTMERIARGKPPVVLAVQDTTSFNYDTHADMEGLGPINNRVDGAQGILLHDTMAYSPEGTALGLVDVQVWARDPKQFGKRHSRYERPIEQKESFKWLKSFQAAARLQRQLGTPTRVVSVGDREADVYELFLLAQSDPANPKLLVRAESDRRVKGTPACLWEYMQGQAVAGERVMHIPRKKGRAPRHTVLQIRFAEVELRPPKRKPTLGALKVWAVYVTEVHPPSQKNAVEWMLLTSVEVNDLEQALEKVDWYKRRWGIEEYHRTIKSVCRIENRQLADRAVWQNCLAIDLVVAWRIEHLKKLSRTRPHTPCSIAFEEHEWQALLAFKRPDQPLPSITPNVREITRLTAELGGFLGRKSDGEPGSTTLARGLQRLQDIATAFLIFNQRHPIQQPSTSPPVASHRDYG